MTFRGFVGHVESVGQTDPRAARDLLSDNIVLFFFLAKPPRGAKRKTGVGNKVKVR